jgi:uncharacterized membrane protein HdeD (DUF308 family)
MAMNGQVWIPALRGVLAIVFGILALIWPGITVLALALLFGAFVLVNGVMLLIASYRRRADGGQRPALIVAGVLGLLAGLVTLIWPGVTTLVLVVLIGAWAVVTGLAEIWGAAQLRAGWLPALIGALTVIAGVLILVRPGVGAVALATVLGIYAIVVGVLLLVASVAQCEDGVDHRPRDDNAGDTEAGEQARGQPTRRTGVDQHIPDGGEAGHGGTQQERVGGGAGRVLALGVPRGLRRVEPPYLPPDPAHVADRRNVPSD